ncbi:hypothetical protein [Vagococcus fluvialis]|nr:hypothetical protein [Vagococcus fluvialis]
MFGKKSNLFYEAVRIMKEMRMLLIEIIQI